MNTLKPFLCISLVICLSNCKKQEVENPLNGDWRIVEIYTKYSNPVLGLIESTVDTEKYLTDKGFYPGHYTHVGFYAADSVYLKLAEPIDFSQSIYLYPDPKFASLTKVEKLKGTYSITAGTIILKLSNSVNPYEFKWKYELNGNKLTIITKDIDRLDSSNKPYYDKEILRLLKE